MDTSIWSNTALEEVFDGIHTAQEIDAGIQARSGTSAALSEKPKAQLARELGVRVGPLRTWRLEFEKEAVTGIAKPDRSATEDLEQLRRENAKLKLEIARSYPDDPPRQPRAVRCSQGARRANGARGAVLPQHRGQADTQGRDLAQSNPALPRDYRFAQDQGIAEPRQTRLHVTTSERLVAERHYLHTHKRRLALPGCGSRRDSRALVGWAMSRTLGTQLAMDALNMAIAHRGRSS